MILEEEIRDVVIGDDWPIERIYRGAPPGTVINKATLTIKENEDQPDAEAAAQIVITNASSLDGQITNTGFGGIVALKIKVPRNKTSEMKPQPYVYDIRLEHSSGDKGPREKGTIYPSSGVMKDA